MWRYVAIVAATLVLLASEPATLVSGTLPSAARGDDLAPGPPAPPAALATALSRLHEEVRPTKDGRLAIVNRAYHATFSADEGVVYTPRSGPPQIPALRWQYRARTLETRTTRTRLDPVDPRVSPTGDHVVDFVRPGLIERYVGRPEGVEQVFVIENAPEGTEDLRIRGEVTFDGARRAADGTLEFQAEGQPPFTYAAPVAFDADRRPLPVRATLEGDDLVLVLDGPALASARFPVTIDPLFGVANAYALGAYPWSGPDVAYNWARDEFLVAFNAPVPALPAEDDPGYPEVVRVKRFYSHGDAVDLSQPISSQMAALLPPRVAYDMHTDRYLVTWTGSTNEVTFAAAARLLDSAGLPLSGDIALGPAKFGSASVAARNQRAHGLADVAFAVAWLMDSDPLPAVRRALVTGSGQVLSTSTVGVVNDGHPLAGPSLSYDPFIDRFFLVWQGWLVGSSVTGWTIAPSGAHGSPVAVANGLGIAPGWASVAFDVASRRHLAVFSTESGYAARLLSSAVNPQPLGASFPLTGVPAHDTWGDQRVVADAGSFLVAYPAKLGSLEQLLHQRLLPGGQIVSTTTIDATADHWEQILRAGVSAGQQGHVFGAHLWMREQPGDLQHHVRVSRGARWSARAVHGRSGDFDGDGKSDLFVFRPASSAVQVKTATGTVSLRFGSLGGIPVLLDWDGDGLVDIGVFRPATGVWTIRLTGSGAVETITNVPGGPGDIPVPGDYVGDGADEIAIFRPWTGTWYIRQRATGQPFTPAFSTALLGKVGDLPVPADWDGDGKIELGVFRQETGVGVWHLREVDGTLLPSVTFGQLGDLPLQGHFVGTSGADQVVYRKSTGTWHRRDGLTGAVTAITQNAIGQPMPLDFNGDGRLELVLFDEATGTWAIVDPSGATNVSLTVPFGGVGDIPAGTR